MTVTFYVTSWCPDCTRSRRVLQRLGVSFEEIDIEETAGAEAVMMEINGGSGKIPTVVIDSPAGRKVLIEPNNRDLTDAICSVAE